MTEYDLLLDTSAWIELFKGTDKGKVINQLITTKKCYTSAISLAELVAIALKIGDMPDEYLFVVKSLSNS